MVKKLQTNGDKTLKSLANNLRDVIHLVYSKTDIEFDIYVSKINLKGMKLLNSN